MKSAITIAAATKLKFGAALVLLVSVAIMPARSQSQDITTEHIYAYENGLIDWMRRGDDNPERFAVSDRLKAYGVPSISLAIIGGGNVVHVKSYGNRIAGRDSAADPDTVYSAGSVSKMINAALVLRLVDDGLVDLEEDVNTYLKSWIVPDGEPVTLRALLSHTSGLSQHGFPDYLPGQALPTAIETLNGSGPSKTNAVKRLFEPGAKMKYSGGGITVIQVLVEDVTGMTYEQAARKYVFDPLGMDRSTFVNPLPVEWGNIANAHDEHGNRTALPRGWEAMPEMAASGLWTSANDMGLFVASLLKSYSGESSFLPKALVSDMFTRVPNSWHGLGPRVNGSGASFVFHHGGANNSYRSWIEGHPATGDGLVILTNGTDGHWVRAELRRSIEEVFGWAVKSDGGFEEPDFID